MIKTIGIIGAGYVGEAVRRFFQSSHGEQGSLKIYDKFKKLDSKEEINKCDLGIVCVPTPTGEDGSVDISVVEEVIQWLETPLILIKSTIAPGTTEKLKKKYGKRIIFSPEYVGESKYYIPEKYLDTTDMAKHSFFTFGGDPKDTQEIIDLFIQIGGPAKRYIQIDATTAELAKYMENTFFATKIMFCNEWFDIAEKFGVDYHQLRECWLADPRINPMHTAVFKNDRGFGGKCLPKDIKGIISSSEKAGYEPKLLKKVIENNEMLRKSNKDK